MTTTTIVIKKGDNLYNGLPIFRYWILNEEANSYIGEWNCAAKTRKKAIEKVKEIHGFSDVEVKSTF